MYQKWQVLERKNSILLRSKSFDKCIERNIGRGLRQKIADKHLLISNTWLTLFYMFDISVTINKCLSVTESKIVKTTLY